MNCSCSCYGWLLIFFFLAELPGLLGGTCTEGYIYRGETKVCHVCEKVHTNAMIVCGVMATLCALVFALATGRINLPFCRGCDSVVAQFLASIDIGALKVCWVTYQIVISCSWSLDIRYPFPFSHLLGLLSFFTLDFLAVECFQEGDVATRYFTTVYLWSAIPLLVGLCIVIIGALRVVMLGLLLKLQGLRDGFRRRAQQDVCNQHVWLLLLLSYLTLPPVAMKQFQSLDCIPFGHDGSSHLRVDTAIDCNSADYHRFRSICVCFIAVYQLVPVTWTWLLCCQRHELNPATSAYDERTKLFIRDRNAALTPLRFLFNDLRLNKWWFEICDMYRRILFVAIVPLCSPVPATRASFGIVLSIASLAFFLEEKPYRLETTNFVAVIAQYAILVNYYAALAIDTEIMITFGLDDLGIGLFLCGANLLVFGVVLGLGWKRFRLERIAAEKKKNKVDRREAANEFTRDKFQTTFDAIQHTSVPASHAMLFYCE